MKSRKGFTLVELLAVIVIMGVITGMSIPLIRNLQKTMTEKKYTAYLTSLKTSAKLYNDSYSDDLFGHNKTGVACLTYDELSQKNLLKDIGIDDISCNHENTYVRITKLDDKYVYSPFLVCGKKENNKAKTIEKILPEEGSADYEEDVFCGDSNSTNSVTETIKINATSDYISNKYDKKRRKTNIEITSATGIYNKINISAGWTTGNSYENVKEWTKLSFKIKENQKESLLNGSTINTISQELVTPKKSSTEGEGVYYLYLRVDSLQDLYGNKWSSSNSINGKYLKFGPFAVDNTPPTITNLKVETTNSKYNSLDTKLKFTGSDNHPENMKMCISQNTSKCTNFVAYNGNTDLKLGGSYDGTQRTIYVTLKDSAGNTTSTSVIYRVAIKHTLTYSANGGTVCSPASKSIIHNVGDGTTWGDLCTTTNKGNTFTGWNTLKAGTGTAVTSNTKVEKNMTIYAQWRLNKIYILISTSGGTLSPTHGSNIGVSGNNITVNNSTYVHTIDYGGTLTNDGLVNWNNPTYINIVRTGYQAQSGAEWKDTKGNTYNQTEKYAGSKFCNADAKDCSVTLYVNWAVAKYTVRFNPNGGSVTTSSKTVTYNSAYGTLPTPTRTGHSFAGWYTAATGGTNKTAKSIYTATANSTLYAHWNVKGYKVTFAPNGGSVTTTSKTVTYNTQYGDLPTPTRANYTFAGWYTAASGGSKVESTTKYTNAAATTLYAHWNINTYTLRYDKAGGNGCDNTITKQYNQAWGTLCIPSKEGYNFTGWKNGTAYITATSLATSNITVIAQWEARTFTLTYDNNGGYDCYNTISKKTGQTWGELCTPHKDGHTFLGWYDISTSTKIEASTVVTKNITARARWDRARYTLRYDDNRGYDCSYQTITRDANDIWGTLCEPYRPGYTFKGWYTNGTKVTWSTPATANITVVAKWTNNRCPYRNSYSSDCPSRFDYDVDDSCNGYCTRIYETDNQYDARNMCQEACYGYTINCSNYEFRSVGTNKYQCKLRLYN